MLYEILSDLINVENLLFVIKNSSATSEIKSNNLNIKRHEKWITLGQNEDPAHMHLDSEKIKSIKFVREEKPDRTSFSIRFFNENDEHVLAVFFTKMYDDHKKLNTSREKIFNDLFKKYGSPIFL